ncbi:MAG: VTT domain-containing protein [Candidatus Bathyarchaeia archaeon]
MSGNNHKLGVLKIPWVRSSLTLGLVFLVIGLALILAFKIFSLGKTQLFLDVGNLVREYGFAGVFLATILAGTVVPLGSPALVVAAASFGLNPALLALTATAGFTIGMAINYFLAYHLGRPYLVEKMGAEGLEAATAVWNRWGWFIYVLFGFIPILPVEFLALVCGLLKTRIQTFLLLSFTPRLVVFMLLAYFGEALGMWLGLV